MITLVNGNPQSLAGLVVPNGSISLQLNIDATVIASPYGVVLADIPIVFQFNAAGAIQPNAPAAAAQIYSNKELNPQNAEGLGTYYLVTFYDQNGARLNASPMWWQFTQVANTTVDIGQVVPFATVGGNVIFYPTVFAITPPGPSTLGGVFSNVGAPSQWINAINTNGSVSLSQPAFTDISGTLSNAQLPSPLIFAAVTASGLITAQAGIEVGVIGTTSGQIALDGSTSGQATITAPAIADVPTNPIVISNSVSLGATCVLTAPGGVVTSTITASGLLTANAGILASKTLTTATQPTFRLTDSELTLSSAVTSVNGSVAGVRGAITAAAGGTLGAGSFLYGTQGKLILDGTLNNGSGFNAGIFGQLDTSNAGFAHTSGYLAPIMADYGATSHLASDPLGDMMVLLNTTTSLIHSLIHGIADASYFLDLTDLNFGGPHFIQPTPVNTGDLANVKIKVRINGVDYFLPLYTA